MRALCLLACGLCTVAAAQPRVNLEAKPGCDPAFLTVAGDVLYFTADDGISGREIWSIDTAGKVLQASDVPPGPDDRTPVLLTPAGNELLFVKGERMGNDNRLNIQRTRRGHGGAVTLTRFDLNSKIHAMHAIGDTLYVNYETAQWGAELWKLNLNSPEPEQVTDLGTGPAHGMYEGVPLYSWNGMLFFGGLKNGDPGSNVLWRATESTPPEEVTVGGESVRFNYMAGFRSGDARLFLRSFPDILVWESPESPPRSIRLNGVPDDAILSLIALSGDRLFFSCNTEAEGRELWVTDGTQAGTRLVRDIQPGPTGSDPYQIEPVRGGVCFVARDEAHGIELWYSDGTEAGTRLIKDMVPGPRNAEPYALKQYNSHVYFSCYHDTYGEELWRTDGTEEGTTLVADINPGAGSSEPYYTAVFDDALYFTATDGVNGFQVWRSEGTAATTKQATWIRPRLSLVRSSSPRELTRFGNRVYFSAELPGHGRELCASDGTIPGTGLVFDQTPGPEASDPRDLRVVDGALYYRTGPGERPTAWRLGAEDSEPESVGDFPEAPFELPDVDAAGVHYVSGSAVKAGDRYLFAGYTPEHGVEPWVYVVTTRNVALLKDIFAGPTSSAPDDFRVHDDRITFRANSAQGGTELYATTGEPGNATLLLDTNFAESSGVPHGTTLGAVGAATLVRAPIQAKTPVGEGPGDGYRVVTQSVGVFGSPAWLSPYIQPRELAYLEDTVFFVCDTPWNGRELWFLQQDAYERALVCDLYPNEVRDGVMGEPVP